MNANELADWLNNYASNSYCIEFEQASTMLRKQQSEIEKIEKLMNFWKESYNELRSLNG